MKEVSPNELDTFLGNKPAPIAPSTPGDNPVDLDPTPSPQNAVEQITQATQQGNSALSQLNELVGNLNQLMSNGKGLMQMFGGEQPTEGAETAVHSQTTQTDYKQLAQSNNVEQSPPVPANIQASNIHTYFTMLLEKLDDNLTIGEISNEWRNNKGTFTGQLEQVLQNREEKKCPPKEYESNTKEEDTQQNAPIADNQSPQHCKNSPSITEEFKLSDSSEKTSSSKEKSEVSPVPVDESSRTNSSSKNQSSDKDV